MSNAVVYIHGKGGNIEEADHYKALFPNCDVFGFDYQSSTPWDAIVEFTNYFSTLKTSYSNISIIANSIGAFYAVNALNEFPLEYSFFISPVVNMEELIINLLKWNNSSEKDLETLGAIETSSGEILSWEYLTWVRNHTPNWNHPAFILYGEKDNLQSIENIREFSSKNGAILTIMKDGEHWFHTENQMEFLDNWILDIKDKLIE